MKPQLWKQVFAIHIFPISQEVKTMRQLNLIIQ